MTMPLVDIDMSGFILFARVQSSGMPLKELSHVKFGRLTRDHISKNIPKSSKIQVIIPVELTGVLRDVK